MSEEIKKNAELSDNELEQVSGGIAALKKLMKQCDSPERHTGMTPHLKSARYANHAILCT